MKTRRGDGVVRSPEGWKPGPPPGFSLRMRRVLPLALYAPLWPWDWARLPGGARPGGKPVLLLAGVGPLALSIPTTLCIPVASQSERGPQCCQIEIVPLDPSQIIF